METVKKRRLSVIPARSLGTVENVIGRPVCTVEEARAVIADFHRRLEAIVSACTRIGCLPILIIPPGNDACDPNQSYASPDTGAVARHALFDRLARIRALEENHPDRAIAAYREFVAEQPMYAHAHYRLARLLESAGSFTAANDHYILARDTMECRCDVSRRSRMHTVLSPSAAHRLSCSSTDRPC